jgi:hypothetical protein
MIPEWKPVAGGQAAESLAAGVGGWRWGCRRFPARNKKSLTYPWIHKAFVFLALSFLRPGVEEGARAYDCLPLYINVL